MSTDFNPYEVPESRIGLDAYKDFVDEGKGVWRDGDVLVMVKPASLPSRCVKCNEPATTRLKRKLYWHQPWIYIMILVSWPIYVVLALCLRQKVETEIPLCERHRAGRIRNIAISWGFALSGFACFFVASVVDESIQGFLILMGVFLVLGGLIYAIARTQLVRPKKIDYTHAWIKKVCPAYLNELPNLKSAYQPQPKSFVVADDEI